MTETGARPSRRPSLRLSLGLLVVSGVIFAVLAALLVPWHWVPGGHYASVAPDQVFTPAQIARANAYAWPERIIAWASLAVSMVVSLLLGLTRLGRRLLGRLRGWWWLRVLTGTFLVLLIGTVVTLPLDWWSHARDLDFGLSRQSAAGWWQDLGTSFLVTWVFTAIGMLVVVGLARLAPRTWPLWTGLTAAALAVVGSFVYPIAVEPLFNHFTPMAAGAQRSDILALARKEHVHISDVLVADASRRTTTLNAYVSGFGSTRRVVVYDNLLTQLPRRQVDVVVAHELGHARNNDVLLGTALGAVGSIFGVALLGLVMGDRRLLRRTAVGGAGDPSAVALLLALAAVGTLLASPVQNLISRDIEARADRASLAATGDYADFVAMQRRLAVGALSSPEPPRWSEFWFGTHPTTLQRIGIARALQAQALAPGQAGTATAAVPR